MARPMKKLSDFDKKLGSVVRSKRVKVGLTRAQLAELTGIAEANLKRREAGANEITVSELKRIAEAVGVPAAELADEALKDFGGMDKLIGEHVGMSDVPVNLDAHRKRRTPADMDEDEWGGLSNAAGTDPELEQDEPENP